MGRFISSLLVRYGFFRLSELRPEPDEVDVWEQFAALINAEKPEVVCEVGTLQSTPGHSTNSWGAFPHVKRANYVMVDVQAGPDVDVVANIHNLPEEWTDRFNAFVAGAVFEHLERPWIAAKEVARVLAPGGFCFITTHQTFPLHGYPKDFFRFSKDALALIFADAGLEILHIGYKYRSMILMPRSILPFEKMYDWNNSLPSFLVVSLVARKARA